MSLDVENLKTVITEDKSILKIVKKMEKDGYEAVSMTEVKREARKPEPELGSRNPFTMPSLRKRTEKHIVFRKIEKMDFE